MRIWRNWQTRMVQVHVRAISWRFKSSYPHHRRRKHYFLAATFLQKSPFALNAAAPCSQKSPLSSPVCLQARSQRQAVATSFLRYCALRALKPHWIHCCMQVLQQHSHHVAASLLVRRVFFAKNAASLDRLPLHFPQKLCFCGCPKTIIRPFLLP